MNYPLEENVKNEAKRAMDEVLDGKCTNPVQENFRLRFISASAKYLRSIRELEYARKNPNVGFRNPPLKERIDERKPGWGGAE